MTNDVKKYIANGETEKALSILLSYPVVDKNIEREIALLSNRYNKLKSKSIKGIISTEDILLEESKISDSLLSICESIDLLDRKASVKKAHPSIENLLLILFISATLILLLIYIVYFKDYDEKCLNNINTELIDNELQDYFYELNGMVNSGIIPPSLVFPNYDQLINPPKNLDSSKSNNYSESNSINYSFQPNLSAKEYFDIGVSFKSVKDYPKAILNFSKAIQDSLTFTSAFIIRGMVRRILQDYEGAIADYNIALKLSPNNPIPMINRSVVYSYIGENEKGIEDCLAAIKIEPNIPESYNSLGNCLANKGLFEQAIVQYTKALDINPQYGHALIGRGIVYYRIDPESGKYCDDWNKAKKLGYNLNFENIGPTGIDRCN